MTPSTDWKEVVPADEAARFEAHAQTLAALQKAKQPISRGLHAKAQAGAEATFTVLPDLPEHARAGLFSKPGTYKAYVRYSNGVGARQPDRKPDVRGVGIKVVGVEGKKIIPGLEHAKTQDFLAIVSPTTPFIGADDFVWFVSAMQNPGTLLPKAFARLGVGKTFKLLGALVRSARLPPLVSVATATYFSAVPIQWGRYAVMYSIAPHAQNDAGAVAGKSPNYLGEEFAQRIATRPVSYDFRVQFFVDEQQTPIEDASVQWNSPWVTVGRLELPAQDLSSPRGQKVSAAIEAMSFDPWHALEAHRPLGNMMRARNAAYRVSTQERKCAPEPDGTEQH